MPSTKTELTHSFPRNLVLGANSRIGGMLRTAWAGLPVTWQARTGGPGVEALSILDNAGPLAALAARHETILCLAGVVTPEERLADNTALALAALRASAASHRPHVFLCSTAGVYGRENGPHKEQSELRPLTPYARSKMDMERAALAEADKLGVPVTILRIGNVAGADAILGGWRPGFLLDRLSDGRTPQRSYIGPFELGRVLAELQQNRAELPQVLNLALPGTVQMGDLLDAAGLAWTAQAATERTIARVELDTSRLTRHLARDLTPATATGIVADWQRWKEEAAHK